VAKAVETVAGGRRIAKFGALATALTVSLVGLTAPAAHAAGNTTPTRAESAPSSPLVIPRDKLPANAVKLPKKTSLPTAGKHGPAFQKGTATTGSVSPNIVGGSPVNASDYPWIVGVETYFFVFDDDGNASEWVSTCTGTIISSTKILTAGHCTVDFNFGATVVTAGANVLDTNPQAGFVDYVASTWTDQSFNYASYIAGVAPAPVDDVSVLTLEQPLPSQYTPITLQAQGDQSAYTAGTSALAVGYGVSSTNTEDSGTLRAVTIPVQDNATCAAAMGSGYDGNRMTCAGTADTGTCFGDSGGPLVVDGVEIGITDWTSEECAGAGNYGVFERLSYYSDAVKADLTRSPVTNLDFGSDGHADLLARDKSGNILEYSGSGLLGAQSGFASGGVGRIGTGWQGFKKLFRVTDWLGDDTESVMATDSSGRLYLFPGDGQCCFTGDKIQVGNGWNMFSDIMVVNNWMSDGLPDLLGRTPTGDLYLYESDQHGGWKNGGSGVKIGTGWNMFNTVLTPGIWKGDGHQALIGRTSTGDLYLYESDGHGGWTNGGSGVKIGSGWNMFSIFMSPGDWNGDDQIDLIGVTSDGKMRLYETDGKGNWLNASGQQIGTGWNQFNAVF
jgi:hypothetical protein